jgi:site-specific recombinase XerD
MHAHLKAFLQFLRLNRNASAHTVRAYESDVTQFLDHAAVLAGIKRAALEPSQLDRTAIRGFLADLHKRLSRASPRAGGGAHVLHLRRESGGRRRGRMVPTPKRSGTRCICPGRRWPAS